MKKILLMALAATMMVGCAKKAAQAESEEAAQEVAEVVNVEVAGEWNICQMEDMAMAATEELALPTLSFEEGMYHMYCGCNQVNGAYTLEGDQLTLDGGVSTKMFCPDVMELEEALVALLNGTYTVKAEEEALVLCNEAGATVLRLVK